MAYGNDKFDKRWEIRSVQVAQPAAGADWNTSPPAGTVWRVKSVVAKFVASSTVGNRTASVFVDDGTNGLFVQSSNQAMTASSTTIICAAEGAPQTPLGTLGPIDGLLSGLVNIPVPQGLVLTSSMRIGFVTNGIVAGDQWSLISLLVEQGDAS